MPAVVRELNRGSEVTKWILFPPEMLRYLLETILREMESGLVVLNPEGRIIGFNRSAQKITGYRKEEVIGKFYRDLWGTNPSPSIKERRISVKGRKIQLRSKISPVIDRDGKLLGWVEIFEDLFQANQKTALAEVGEAAAQVAHEIRSPLGGIRGFASLLQREAREESQERLLSRIVDGVANIDRLVNDLLNFTGPQPQSEEITDLNRIVQEALTCLAQDQELEGIEIEKQLKGGELKIEGNSLKLRQALFNLLLNAVQAMPQGGRLSLKSFQRGNKAFVTLSDTGCGIPPQYKGEIFKPFFSRKEGGTGLGLALVKKIVTAHGGKISLQSRPGRGTIISLLFPLSLANDSPIKQKP